MSINLCRTHSPYSNSFLYAPSAPQPSQNFFLTPFYSSPMTPTSAGLSSAAAAAAAQRSLVIGGSQHHPHSAAAAAAASSYFQQQQAAGIPMLPPSQSYLSPSQLGTAAHHSVQPSPAPGWLVQINSLNYSRKLHNYFLMEPLCVLVLWDNVLHIVGLRF